MAFEEVALWLFELIRAHGAISVFLGVVLEEVIVPIPSPLVIMGAGAILIPAGIAFSEAIPRIFITIVVPGSIGTVVGSFFIYALGYYGGKPVLKRFGKFFDLSWEDVNKTSRRLGKGRKVWLSIALLRAVPVFPTSPVSFVSGALRLDPKKYAIATFFGSIPRIFILAFLGWYFGSAYAGVAGGFDFLEKMMLVSAVLLAGFLLYVHHKRIAKRVGRVWKMQPKGLEKQRCI